MVAFRHQSPGDTRAIAAYVADRLRNAGCAVTTLAPENKPEAASIIASIGTGEPVIMLHAHTDTVPVAANEARQWSMDPYAAVIKDGRLYGKGSVDDKAPLSAMMSTLMQTARHPDRLRGTLVLVAAAEEETGGRLGTKWLADNGHLPCDYIVVAADANRRASAQSDAATVGTGRSVCHQPDRREQPRCFRVVLPRLSPTGETPASDGWRANAMSA
jgi:succinyl-diaminopimelate desuccinylase